MEQASPRGYLIVGGEDKGEAWEEGEYDWRCGTKDPIISKGDIIYSTS
jgi:hypothetical protein